MNKRKRNQAGGSAVSNIILLIVFGFAVWVGIQYVPQWIEASAVDTILENLQRDNRNNPSNSAGEVWKKIDAQLNTNQMLDMKEHFTVTQNVNTYKVIVSYERDLNLLFTRKPMPYKKTVTLE